MRIPQLWTAAAGVPPGACVGAVRASSVKMRSWHLGQHGAGLLVAVCWAAAGTAWGQTGVSDDRVSLPEGPGSLEGVGENVEVNANMGVMAYQVPIPLPDGHAGMTPDLSLNYTSGGGQSVVGMGWDLTVPSLERSTVRGLPRYASDDKMVANGSQELIRTNAAEPAEYRARMEGAFIRYRWHARGTGAEGYWTAEYPDGKKAFFGADQIGMTVDGARISGVNGTFRWLPTEMVDGSGHTIRYTWRRQGTTALLDTVSYGFRVGGTPRFQVVLDHEMRQDRTSDCKPGFCEVLSHRLSGIRILSGAVQLQRWVLTYEDLATAGGASRLVKVTRYGMEGGKFPVELVFTYSRALGGVCQQAACARPFLVSMGSLGLNLRARNATLIDINGDALPDVVDTTSTTRHRFFLARFRSPGDHTFMQPRNSGLQTGSGHLLSAGAVEILDVNGDGFSDLLNTVTGLVLENGGAGDWSRRYQYFSGGDGSVPDLESDLDPADGDLQSIRFVDYDNDKRIDIMKSRGAGTTNETSIYRNLETGFLIDTSVQKLATGFETDRVQLADMNGDGLMDVVELSGGVLNVKLALGYGQWEAQPEITGLPFTETELAEVELEDLNNDGLSDLVIVKPDEVRYALGRVGTRFDDTVFLTSSTLGFSVPIRDNTVTVLYADMNASGSDDVVWIDQTGNVQYLELFPVQPHLLSRIENGLGMVTDITYGTTVQQAARDEAAGRPWVKKPPFAMTVVTRVDSHELLSGVHQIEDYSYSNGFFDGVEKKFRGYQSVVMDRMGDDSIESGQTTSEFDVGDTDPWRAGLNLRTTESTGTRQLSESVTTYNACAVDGIPAGLVGDIRYICPVAQQQVAREGAPASEWVTTLTEMEYDGYGNTTRSRRHGVVSVGGAGCGACTRLPGEYGAPCGEMCLGDELIAEQSYISPLNTGGRWILDRVWRKRQAAADGEDSTEVTYFYDGEPFVGLPAGQLTEGHVTRSLHKVNALGDTVPGHRLRYDNHGNVVEVLASTADPLVADNGRTLQFFDQDGINLSALETLHHDREGNPYALRQEWRYDPLWNRVAERTEAMLKRGGMVVSPRSAHSVTYDEFGRVSTRSAPGDAVGVPGERFRYELGSPTSRVVMEARSQTGSAYDLQTVGCFDGVGRLFQQRTRISDTNWFVGGLTQFNRNGSHRREYEPFSAGSGQCDTVAPSSGAYTDSTYDSIGRPLVRTTVDGTNTWREEHSYGPLQRLTYDRGDTDTSSPHAWTPQHVSYDGQGRLVEQTDHLAPLQPLSYTFTYDAVGQYSGYRDPAGNKKRQLWDLAGRLVQVEDPDRGTTVTTYDDAGDALETTDARGVVFRMTRDGHGRVRDAWDAADRDRTLVSYHYDQVRTCPAALCTNAAGRLVEADHPLGSLWYGYSAEGLQLYRGTNLRGRLFETRFEYDNADRLTRRTLPDGRVVNYLIDAANRPTAIPGFVDALDYDGLSRLQGLTYANGVTESRAFASTTRLGAYEVRAPDGTPLISRRYVYDAQGNITVLTDMAADASSPSASAAYGYDALGRLTSAQLDSRRAPFEETLSLAYDGLGNLTHKTSSRATSPEHVGDYTYTGPAPHAVTRAGNLALVYDAAGNMTQRGDQALVWDHLGRLTRIAEGSAEKVRNYYGPGSEHVLQESQGSTTWTVGADFTIKDGVATAFIGLGPHYLAKVESLSLATRVLSDVAPLQVSGATVASLPDGKITVADAWVAQAVSQGDLAPTGAPPLDGTRALLKGALAQLLGSDGEITFLHTDERMNVVATTDGDGVLEGRTTYYPHGAERTALPSGGRGYNGMARVAGGLIDYGERHLDPVLGRWSSPDPAFAELHRPGFIRTEEEAGAYAAMHNNPVRYRDAGGLYGVESAGWLVAGIIVGAADWAHWTAEEAAIRGESVSKLKLAGYAIAGAAVGGLSAVVSDGSSVLEEAGSMWGASIVNRGLELAGVESAQARLDARRLIYVGVGAGISLALIFLTGGLAIPVALGILAVGLTLKLAGIAMAHHGLLGRMKGWFSKGNKTPADAVAPTADTTAYVSTAPNDDDNAGDDEMDSPRAGKSKAKKKWSWRSGSKSKKGNTTKKSKAAK